MIYIIRHGQTEKNKANVLQGRSDVPLNEAGVRQAEEAAKWFAEQGIAFDAVYSSPLTRARRLAAYCGYPDPVIENRVLEVNYGKWEMTSFIDDPDPAMLEWYRDWKNVRPPGGESFRDAFIRLSGFIEELKSSGMERVAVFCHGGMLICAAIYAGSIDFDASLPGAFEYGEILKINV